MLDAGGDRESSLVHAPPGPGWNLADPGGVDLVVTGREKGGMAIALVLAAAVFLAARHPALQLPLAVIAGSAAVVGAVITLLQEVTHAAFPGSDGEGSNP